MKKCALISLFLLLTIPGFSQSSFKIENSKGYFKQKFDLVNDLVILPVWVNGVELTFLLDTGINATIIFSLESVDSLEVKNATSIYLRGLGAGKPIPALKSLSNKVILGDAIDYDHSIYILTEEVMELSSRLGVPVNGILGYEFFKDFIVEMNYPREFIKVYNPETYEYKRCRRCTDIPIRFHRNKPYLEAEVEMPDGSVKTINLLLDNGSGDAVWLFEDEERQIKVPEKNFEDFLGFGISGSVYGKRTRINRLNLGDLELREITVSFPDSLYIKDVKSFEDRDGSLGSRVMKRFHSVLDYPNKRLRLKPNRYFNDPFEYNMSGVVVEHKGYELKQARDFGYQPSFSIEADPTGAVPVFESTYKLMFALEPQFRIAEIRPSSPAEMAGLKKGDIILKLNGREAKNLSLEKISGIFESREGRKIRLKIERDGVEKDFEFRLERIL
ncbi:aspartyl protease family protein [Salegentibacter chungangensis]|uniref:Aspartyl protease family protein n=1 Tax=Salegentibacter chungangensis TaxID=1335724 RepID=A0ABW3NVZ5_9FLAO